MTICNLNRASARAIAAVLLLAASSFPARAAPSDVSRGQYVAEAADCAACHTQPGGKPFAGGRALHTPFGIIYGSNITPDPQSGIGGWSETDFERALRNGVRKDGSDLYPAMPYQNYTKMTPDDLHALWAYLRTVAPISNQVPANTLPFPLNMREGLQLWQSLYFRPGPFEGSTDQTQEWNRGAYLTQVLGHCDQCHTPRNAGQGLQADRELTGGQAEGWYAPNISGGPLSTLTDWSTGQLVEFFKTGRMRGNASAVGPMRQVIEESLRHLSEADLRAMAVYLKNQKPSGPASAPSPAKWPARATAEALYRDQCASCHQGDGKGIEGSVPALAGNAVVTSKEPSNVIMAMLDGFAPRNNWGAMGSFAGTLSDEQIADVANYIRTAWGNAAPPNATPWAVDSLRKYAKPQDISRARLCPNLKEDVIKPALALGSDSLQAAATDAKKMQLMIQRYRSSIPNVSNAQVIEALSTAYCRAVAENPAPKTRMEAQLITFAQKVSAALPRKTG